MGYPRAPRPDELQELVKEVVQELGSASGGSQSPASSDVHGRPHRSARSGRPAYLARVKVAGRLYVARHPVRVRRIAVTGRIVSPLERSLAWHTARVSVPSRPHHGPDIASPGLVGTRADTAWRPSSRRHRLGHGLNLVIAAALSFVLLSCAGVVGLVLTGHHLEQVVTGSMQPAIPIGSIVVSERVPAGSLGVGDILVFPRPDNTSQVIVHRIVDVSRDSSGNVLVRTKGDFNAEADGWTVKRAGTALADRARWVVPGGGTAAAWLRMAGFFGLVGLIIAFVGYQGIKQVRKVLADGQATEEPGAQ